MRSFWACKMKYHKNPAVIDKPSNDSFHKVNVYWKDNQSRDLSTGTVKASRVATIYRDTGCSTVIVANEVLPNIDISKCPVTQVSDYLGNVYSFPVLLRCYLKCNFLRRICKGYSYAY